MITQHSASGYLHAEHRFLHWKVLAHCHKAYGGNGGNEEYYRVNVHRLAEGMQYCITEAIFSIA